MSNVFLIADTHFGHQGVCKFLRNDGSKLRPWATTEEMDEVLVDNWNKVVKPGDRVYHLGDVVMNRRHLATVGRLNGRKKLIRGNHDLFKMQDYAPYFDDLCGVYVLADMILSHIPLARECITTRFGTNVHGHLHANSMNDPVYFCVSVENIDYTPIELGELRKRIAPIAQLARAAAL